jgi:malate dehydrogenase (oxaloacetate-decarboxylating)(NADP+)
VAVNAEPRLTRKLQIGKLALYTAAAGIHPEKTLPIVLDCGTNNETNLKDPLYLGLRQNRISVSEQQEFMDEFMEAAKDVYPEMVVQFEDFESEKAFNYLDRYRNDYKCFNDDIQGTGAVVLGGYVTDSVEHGLLSGTDMLQIHWCCEPVWRPY